MQFKGFLLIIVLLLSLGGSLQGQSISRSGVGAPAEDFSTLRRFPCGGSTVFEENVDSLALPQDWVVVDQDGATPRGQIQFIFPEGGWQVVKDLKDTTNGNFVFASPAWYEDSVAANDWLISPLIGPLPPNTCLSWYAYSVDQFFPEDYEVWVSTSGNTPADFLTNGSLITEVENEGTEFTFRSTSLANFEGEEVFIAFRHTSDDRFILALDQIRLAEVEARDMAIFEVAEIRAKANEVVPISGSIINRGLDSVRFDSGFFRISYQVDTQEVNTYTYPTGFKIAPNDTLNFVHDSLWIPSENKVYRIEVWITRTVNDNNTQNDTLGFWQGIGTFTQNEALLAPPSVVVYPNPASSTLSIELKTDQRPWSFLLFDRTGRKLREQQGLKAESANLDIVELAPGIYLLQIWSEGKMMGSQRIIKR